MKLEISHWGLRSYAFSLMWTLAATGCAKVDNPASGTGETHFLIACDSECPGDLECLCGVCTRPCDADDACGALGGSCESACRSAGMTCDRTCSSDDECADLDGEYHCEEGLCRVPTAIPDAGPVGNGCDPGCEPVTAHPVDEQRACVQLADPDDGDTSEVVCQCNVGTRFELELSCRRRLSDDSMWAIDLSGDLQDDADWTACTGDHVKAALTSCEYAECEEPPLSNCSVDTFCGGGRCDSLEFDAQGCRRLACSSDAECATDERCTAIECASTDRCTERVPGTCQCSGVDACYFDDRCAPTTLAGPRGEWIRLELVQTDEACSDESCLRIRTVTPDGALSYTSPDGDSSDTLEALELGDLRRLIYGAPLRLALRDGIACDPAPTDVVIEVNLELSTETLSRDITGCVLNGPVDNLFSLLFMGARGFSE